MQKRAVLSGRLSFVHTVYPILKVHSTDFFSNIFFFQRPLTRGEEIPAFAHSVRVVEHVSTTKTTHRTSFCALRSQHLLWQMCPSLSLFTTDYPPLSGRWNGIAFPYPSHFLPLYLPTKHRETTERSPRDERLKIAVNFDQNLQFSHLIPLAPTIHHCVNFSDIPCKVSLHFLNMSKITTSTISIA